MRRGGAAVRRVSLGCFGWQGQRDKIARIRTQTLSEEKLLDAESQKCPACAESNKLEAIKCRLCGEEFDPGEVDSQVAEKRAEIKKLLEKEREGKKRCPQHGNWDTRWTTIEDGGMGHLCDNCKKSLKAMGFV